MQNGTGNDPNRSTAPYGTPEGDLVVFAGSHPDRYASRLDRLTDGTPVIAAGMVDGTREHGPIDAPRATLILLADDGAATYAAASSEVLAEYSLCLMDGIEITIHGIARRPFEDGPPYIQVIEVEPHFG